MKSSIVFVMLLVAATYQWHNYAHLATARIARIELEKTSEGKEAVQWIESLLTPFSKMCGESMYPFTECSTWADKIKSQGWGSMFAWHFSNNYIRAPDVDASVPLPVKADANASWAINEAFKTLHSCKQDRKGKSDSLLGKSISVRNLFHYVGDIH